MDNFNWGVRRPSLSHLEGGSSTSLSSASGVTHHAGIQAHDGRGDVGRERDKLHRLEHRHKHSGKTQATGLPKDQYSNRKEKVQSECVTSTGRDVHRNISPVLQNLGVNRNSGVGAEESSDDEMGSVRFYEKIIMFLTLFSPHTCIIGNHFGIKLF